MAFSRLVYYMGRGGRGVNNDKLQQLTFLRFCREDMRRQLSRFERRFSADERAWAAFECARLGLPDPRSEMDAMESEHRAENAAAASAMRRSLSEVQNQITKLLNELCADYSRDELFPDQNKRGEEKLLESDWWEVHGRPALQSMLGD
jgi:hypothetical protein